MAVVRVLLIGDDPLARAGVAAALGAEGEIVVTGQASTADDLAVAVASSAADAALWDLGLSPRAALDRLRELEGGGVAAVALVTGDATARQAIAAGATGVIGRGSDGARIAAALRAVVRGLIVIDETLASQVLATAVTSEEGGGPLTPRETEVLQLIAQGLPNKLIADRLRISEHTAKFHVNSILEKLGAGTRTEAVVRGARLGVIAI